MNATSVGVVGGGAWSVDVVERYKCECCRRRGFKGGCGVGSVLYVFIHKTHTNRPSTLND